MSERTGRSLMAHTRLSSRPEPMRPTRPTSSPRTVSMTRSTTWRQPSIATRHASDHEEATRKIPEYDRKLAQHRAALDAGASPATVAARIAETEAERARYEVGLRQVATSTRPRMTEAEIRSIVDKLTDIARVLSDADPNDKSEIFRQLGLKLIYHLGRRLVEAGIKPTACGFSTVSEGGLRGGIFTTSIPAPESTESNASVNCPALSRTRNWKSTARSPRSISRFRACWTVQGPSGCAVTTGTRTYRVPASITKKT